MVHHCVGFLHPIKKVPKVFLENRRRQEMAPWRYGCRGIKGGDLSHRCLWQYFISFPLPGLFHYFVILICLLNIHAVFCPWQSCDLLSLVLVGAGLAVVSVSLCLCVFASVRLFVPVFTYIVRAWRPLPAFIWCPCHVISPVKMFVCRRMYRCSAPATCRVSNIKELLIVSQVTVCVIF